MTTSTTKRASTKKTTTDQPASEEAAESVVTEAPNDAPMETSTKIDLARRVLLEQLAEPFPPEMLKIHPAKRLTYIPVAEVIARMNRVLGQENWRNEVVRVWREPDHPGWVLAHVRVTARIAGVETSRDGVGGQQVKMLRDKTGAVDLGDEYKGAVSDALKKACQGFGVGLELARSDEALSYEMTSTESSVVTVDAVTEDTWTTFKNHLGDMTDAEKAAIKEWWDATHSTPCKPGIASEAQVQAAIVECLKILLTRTSEQ